MFYTIDESPLEFLIYIAPKMEVSAHLLYVHLSYYVDKHKNGGQKGHVMKT